MSAWDRRGGAGRERSLHWRVFIAAAVKALCSALSEINSAI